MAAGDQWGRMFWGGIAGVIQGSYTCAQGVQPGQAVLVCHPSVNAPDLQGDLIITDGLQTVTVPNCRLADLKATKDGEGTKWTLEIEDRRWKWRECGTISGEYNLRDQHGFLLPWTVQTPTQLAALCLDAMGEQGYSINLPADYLPEVRWDHSNPAHALEQLARDHGAVVVYRLDTDSVQVVRNGEGDDLPGGSQSKAGPSLKNKGRPDTILLTGSPTRHQFRGLCEAVGEEWDGSYLPLRYLSYAPPVPAGRPQKDQIQLLVNGQPGAAQGTVYKVFINDTVIQITALNNTLATQLNALAFLINGNAQLKGIVTATTDGLSLTLQGNNDGRGYRLSVAAEAASPSVDMQDRCLQLPAEADDPWATCGPPTYANVQSTPRLSYLQAVELAKKSVYRAYRVTGFDPDGLTPLMIPNFGRIVRIHQLLLEDTKVQQIDPNVPKDIVIPRDRLLLTNLYYNGWSRDQPAVCYGSYARQQAGPANAPADFSNSPLSEQILVGFRVVAQQYIIVFDEPVYKLVGGKTEGDGGRLVFAPADVYLETAAQVRNPLTNAVRRYEATYTFPGPSFGTGAKVIRHSDIRQNYIGVYDPNTHKLVGVDVDLPDADVRAAYYLLGEAAQWDDAEAAEAEYNGVREIWLDGAIAQVTWRVGGDGAHTQASRNCEHHFYFPDLPERLRLNHLAAPQLAEQNQKLKEALGVVGPWEPKAV